MAPVPGRKFLDRVIARVHAAVQSSARSREEYELGSITLRLLGMIRAGREPNLDVACSEAHGCYFAKWRERSLARESQMAWEFSRLIPDFDPEAARHADVVKASGVRRPEAFSGNLYEMPATAVGAKQKPVRAVSRNSKTAER